MKKSVFLFTAFLIGITTLFAQAPDAFKYQAVARDASGDVIANQQVNITITILQGSTEGTSVYTETHDSTTNEFGLVSLTIGAGDPTGFAAIDWNNGPYFIKVEMDGSLMGTSKLLSVPYAKYADNAGNTFSGNYSDLTGTPNNVSTFTNDAGYLTSYTETDPIFGVHAANGITTTNINNWISAYGWGDHSTIGYTTTDTTLNETEVDNFVANNGYLTSENDPIFGAHAANGITSTNITNWTTAYSWGDHSTIGYTTTDTTLNEAEVDTYVSNNGYLTSETDPVFGTSVASDITTTDTTNWDTAFNWGNHSEAGYLTTAPTIRQSLESGNSADGAIGITGLAETSINATGSKPDASAILDISSTAKGILLPRMNMTQILSINDPEPGLIVMDTTGGDYNFFVFDGLEWIKVIKNSSSYGGLVLWNKLGSIDEVQNSKVGTGGVIVGTSYAFEPGYNGNGYVRKATGENYVNFPGSILQNLKEKGTVELWVNPKVVKPVPYSYGVFAIVGNIFGTSSHVYIAWGDGVSGTGFYGTINFDGTGHQTPSEAEQFEATIGTPFHVVLCWDVNGIDGSTNTLRLYRDGEIIGSLNDTWDAYNTSTNYEGFNLGMGPDGNGYDKFIVDELKVWDYAKINFEPSTGTFIAGDLEVSGTITGSINIDTIHVSQITGLLGQNYTLVFPQILDNTATLEIEGISITGDVVIVNGIGHETERISEYVDEWNGIIRYRENPGFTMEYPLIFETTNETDMLAIKAWFDESTPVSRNAAVVIKNLAGDETGRWNLLNYIPNGYESGTDGRTRFKMIHNGLPDNVNSCEYQNDFGQEHSYNPETDTLVEIQGVDLGWACTPAVEINLTDRTVTLTFDYNEGYKIYDWVKRIITGIIDRKAFSIIQTTNGYPDTEIRRFNYYEAIPIIYEHIYGFGLNTKLKARVVIAYGFREEG